MEQAKKRDHKIFITDVAIEKVSYVHVAGLSERICKAIQEEHKELLRIAQKENDSNEVLTVWNFMLSRKIRVMGTENYVNVATSPEAYGIVASSDAKSVMYLHNHPSTNLFSLADIDTFVSERNVGTMSVVTNQGNVYILNKTNNYSYNSARLLLLETYEKSNGNESRMIDIFLRKCTKAGVSYDKG